MVAYLVDEMTLEEKISLLSARMAIGGDLPDGALGSAAHCPGVPRLGVAAWDEGDASLGVTNPFDVRGGADDATAFPSLTALAATFDADLAEEAGRALGEQARQKGLSVLLAGGANLVRDPRGGRNFEYPSEDVLLTGVMAGRSVRGIQSREVVSTLKHFVLNPVENGRLVISADLSEKALRESDLLAFEIALEIGGPGAVMAAYNPVNGTYASENHVLLTDVLKGDWGFDGFVMSDWGGTHSTHRAVLAGLDRQSAPELDTEHFYGPPLHRAVLAGEIPETVVDAMVRRILGALQIAGDLRRRRRPGALSLDRHAEVAGRVAARSVVLLRNRGATLPLGPRGERIVLIGAHLHLGVPCGGGSSSVTPSDAVQLQSAGETGLPFPRVYHRPAPEERIREEFAERPVVRLPAERLDELGSQDTAVVVVEKWSTEGADAPDLGLGGGQDRMIDEVRRRAGRVVVVLQTAGAVTMPWFDDVDAVLATWYGGVGGSDALAGVLYGRVNPSGRLPVTFPSRAADLPRPSIVEADASTAMPGAPRTAGGGRIDFDVEGADVGYRWFERTGRPCALPFGFGLSYTEFTWSGARVDVDQHGVVRVSVTVTNTGGRAGVEVPQVYLAPPDGGGFAAFRLVAWCTLTLEPGVGREVEIVLDEQRVFSGWDVDDPGWTRRGGVHRLRLARHAVGGVEFETSVELPPARWTYRRPGCRRPG